MRRDGPRVQRRLPRQRVGVPPDHWHRHRDVLPVQRGQGQGGKVCPRVRRRQGALHQVQGVGRVPAQVGGGHPEGDHDLRPRRGRVRRVQLVHGVQGRCLPQAHDRRPPGGARHQDCRVGGGPAPAQVAEAAALLALCQQLDRKVGDEGLLQDQEGHQRARQERVRHPGQCLCGARLRLLIPPPARLVRGRALAPWAFLSDRWPLPAKSLSLSLSLSLSPSLSLSLLPPGMRPLWLALSRYDRYRTQYTQ
mmetsp:Transcript_10060/g.26038  ORF Transcript_10060/g.26038 Transcript_10060/m.26038 type:complete len:250 (+) Transcript_10060:438-1187(+)